MARWDGKMTAARQAVQAPRQDRRATDGEGEPAAEVVPARPIVLTPRFLRRWPLPQPDAGDDKEGRGRVFVVGGAASMPGAVILAATAALRAGAGKLQIATVASIAAHVGAAVPEALVIPLPETAQGGIAPTAAERIIELACQAQATLLGPGMVDEEAVRQLVDAIVPRLAGATVVFDAAPLACVTPDSAVTRMLRGRLIVTPHAGELSAMLAIAKEAVADDALAMARRAAASLDAVIAAKGADTFIAAPWGETYWNRSGNVGLAISGSGDTLSGIIAGLAARGADPLRAAAWGVYLHGRAGDRLAARLGRLGFLPRELLAEVPTLMAELTPSGRRR